MSSSRQWTEDQKKAIYSKDKTLLVSAAAGSGKTAVLVQRVIEKITNSKNSTDIDKILTVTYTKAAAREMKERISTALDDMIFEKPNDENLKRQKRLMSRANISTIHSFCSKLIRDNFQTLGISPSFKIAGETEIKILKQEAMTEVINTLYHEQDKDFLRLSEIFSKDRDDSNLIDTIDNLYEKLRPYPFKEEWKKDKLELYSLKNKDMKGSVYVNTVLDEVNSALEYCMSLAQRNIEYLEEDEALKKTCLDILINDKLSIDALIKSVKSDSWDRIFDKISGFKGSLMRFKAPKGYKDNPIKVKIYENRDSIKKIIGEKTLKLFVCSEEEFFEDMAVSYPLVKKLFYIEELFSNQLDKLKIENNLLDFSDLEHFALKLLVEKKDGKYIKTTVAKEISENFDEIMIDEYQDINEVQQTIFEAISRDKKNLFMVGDIKQSIYRFRNAMPELFLQKKESFSPYCDNTTGTSEKIILQKNFRSRKEILDGANFIFSHIMSHKTGQIDYNDEEALHTGLNERNDKASVDIKILDFSESKDLDKNKTEALYIGKLIKDMVDSGYEIGEGLNKRKVGYGDFCILLRSAKKYYQVFEEEFSKLDIPVCTKKEGNFFDTLEISYTVSLLQIIDNPLQDIPLLAVMYGGVYAFTTDDIAKIRSKTRDTNLYYAVLKASLKDDDIGRKCKNLLDDIFAFKQLSVSVTPERLIRSIYEKTGFDTMVSVMSNGDLRLKNLHLLIEYAKEYNQYGARNLSGFLKIIDNAKESQSDFKSAVAGFQSDKAVNIMSMHSSKGLEFPICIVANTQRKFNFMSDGDICINSELGISFALKDETFLKKYKTLADKAIYIKNRNELLSEELRVLYVALTRAREKLIITGCVNSLEKAFENAIPSMYGEKICPYFVAQNTDSFSLILGCMLRYTNGKMLSDYTKLEDDLFSIEPVKAEYDDIIAEDVLQKVLNTEVNIELLEQFKTEFAFEYKYAKLSQIPTKLTVSQLSFNNDAESIALTTRPEFMNQKALNATERGTLIHKFLSYADFNDLKESFGKTAEKLITKGLLSEENLKAIDKDKITAFTETPIFSRILKADKVLKEYSFMVRLDAGKVYKDEDLCGNEIILQGEADCIFWENGEIILLDYKTGRDFNQEKADKYKEQLKLYSYAIEKCFLQSVSKAIIYAIDENKYFEV